MFIYIVSLIISLVLKNMLEHKIRLTVAILLYLSNLWGQEGKRPGQKCDQWPIYTETPHIYRDRLRMGGANQESSNILNMSKTCSKTQLNPL